MITLSAFKNRVAPGERGGRTTRAHPEPKMHEPQTHDHDLCLRAAILRPNHPDRAFAQANMPQGADVLYLLPQTIWGNPHPLTRACPNRISIPVGAPNWHEDGSYAAVVRWQGIGLALLLLRPDTDGLSPAAEVHIRATGPDAEPCAQAVKRLLDRLDPKPGRDQDQMRQAIKDLTRALDTPRRKTGPKTAETADVATGSRPLARKRRAASQSSRA